MAKLQSKDFPVVPRSTVRQRSCSTGSPFSGESRGLRGSPEGVGSPYGCENALTSSSPHELANAASAPYVLPRPHLQHSHQSQVFHCTKRKEMPEPPHLALVRMPPGRLPGEVFQARSYWEEAPGKNRGTLEGLYLLAGLGTSAPPRRAR